MEEKEKVILVGCQLPQDDDEKFMHSMKELASLAKTARAEALVSTTQNDQSFIRQLT